MIDFVVLNQHGVGLNRIDPTQCWICPISSVLCLYLPMDISVGLFRNILFCFTGSSFAFPGTSSTRQ